MVFTSLYGHEKWIKKQHAFFLPFFFSLALYRSCKIFIWCSEEMLISLFCLHWLNDKTDLLVSINNVFSFPNTIDIYALLLIYCAREEEKCYAHKKVLCISINQSQGIKSIWIPKSVNIAHISQWSQRICVGKLDSMHTNWLIMRCDVLCGF